MTSELEQNIKAAILVAAERIANQLKEAGTAGASE
jgi:hypothetical protein